MILIDDEEEKKKRLQEAMNITNRINSNSYDFEKDKEDDDLYSKRLEEAMNITNSINPIEIEPLNDINENNSNSTFEAYEKQDNPTQNTSKKKVQIFKGSKAFEDGYQFGDITKTILGTGTDISTNAGIGFGSVFENIIDLGAHAVATLQSLTGNEESAKKTREWADKDIIREKLKNNPYTSPIGAFYNFSKGNGTYWNNFQRKEIQNIIEKQNNGEELNNIEKTQLQLFGNLYSENNTTPNYEDDSVLGDTSDQVVELIGYTGGLAAGTGLLGGAGEIPVTIGHTTLNLPTLAIVGGATGGLKEADSKGENVSETERWGKAIYSGLIEGTTEGLFGMFGVGGNELTDILGSKVARKISSNAGKILAKIGIQSTGEAIEEFLSYAGNYLADNLIINRLGETDFSSEWDWGEVGEQMALAFVSSAISLGGESIISTNQSINSAEKQLGRKLTPEEKASVVKAITEDALIKAENKELFEDGEDSVGNYFVASYNENGEVTDVIATLGKSFENLNQDLKINPVIIKDQENKTFNIIDGSTGVILDTTPYRTVRDAENGFYDIVSNLSKAQIENINNTVRDSTMSLYAEIGKLIQERESRNEVLRNQQNDTIEQNINQNNEINNQNSETSQNGNSNETNNNIQIDKAENPIQNKSFEDVAFDAMSDVDIEEIKSPLEDRNIETLGKQTNVNAYQYENPEVKPYFQEMAQMIGEDLSYISSADNRTSLKGGGTKLNTTTKAISILHDDLGYSYNDISKGLQNIIDDNGKENNAISKKLELIIDDQLRNGYTNALGKNIVSNQDYIDTINKGGNNNVRAERVTSKNTQQKINRAEKRTNTRGEKKISRGNGTNQEKLSKSIQQFQKEQQKQLGKDFKISQTKQDKLTNTEKIIQNDFKNITGLDYGIYESSKATSEDAVFVNNDILVKHNSLQSKKKSNFLPFHELGHWFKINRNSEWTAIHNIIDNTITKNQIEEYKNVLKDKSMFENMSEAEIREYIIEEIESDYFGNWANDISNWAEMIRTKMLSDEYVQLLIDISDENIVTHYNIFGTQEQQEQVYGKISENMNNFIAENKNSFKNDFESSIKYSSGHEIKNPSKVAESLGKDIDDLLKSKYNMLNEVLLRDNTPQILVNYGIRDLPMYISPTHLLENIISKTKARNMNIFKDDINYHNLGKETFIKVMEALDNPIAILKSVSKTGAKNSVVIITDVMNKNKEHVIVPVYLNGKATYNNVRIDTNKIKTMYGKTDIRDFVDRTVKKDYKNLIYLTNDKNKRQFINGLGLQLSNSINSASSNSITQKNATVKSNTTTNSNMQKSKNNTIKKSDRVDNYKLDYEFPENVKDIKNTNQFLKKAIKNETDKYWSEQLKNALKSNYEDWTRRESPLKWRRGIIQQYLDYKNGTNTNSNGDILTRQQREYFKNSKAVDKYGNLKVVYHGTGTGTFTEFKGGTYGANYYTDNIWSARSYQVGTSPSNKVYKGYLNITNPLIIDAETRNWSEIWRTSIKDEDILKAIDDDLKNKYEIYSTTDIAIAVKATKKYDGIIFNNIYDNSNNNKKELSTVYVTFNSNQFKAIDNKNPTDNPDIRYSNRYDTEENGEGGFYSQLEKVIEDKMPNTSNAQQIKGIIENSGIKQDEIKWIGLDDYLKQHSLEKITKQQLQDYIKANQINIETVKKSMNNLEAFTAPIKEDISNKEEQIKDILDKYGIDYEEDDVSPYRRDGTRSGLVGDYMAENLEKLIDFADFEKEDDGRYINSYWDRDGVTRRIYGFTEQKFKDDMKVLEGLYEKLHEAQMNLSMAEDEYGDNAEEIGTPQFEKYSLEGGTNYQELLYTLPFIEEVDNNGKTYKNQQIANVDEYNSPHWREKNVLAHARIQDFKDTSGNKVLFIDEIQSDLHQDGRKKGYLSKEDSKKKVELQNKINDLKDEYMRYEDEMKNLKSKAFNNAKETYIQKQNEAIKQSSLLEEKYNIQNNLTEEQQYELLDYVNKIEDYLVMQNRQFMIFRENVDNNEYMQQQVQEAEEKLKLKLPEEILEKQKDSSIYRQHAIESFRIRHYDQSEVRYGTLYSDSNNHYLTQEEQSRITELNKIMDNIKIDNAYLIRDISKISNSKISDVFPFKKNWHEFVLRRMINNAVEQGYDEVAWTTGRQQRERYNLAKVIDYIYYQKQYNNSKDIEAGNVADIAIRAYKDGNKVFDNYVKPSELADYIGKDLASKILESENNNGEINNLNETINENSNSGMYVFYDQEIPNYLNKYLKKWNSKVEEITLKDADGKSESKQMGFKITDEMRNSIKQNGQPLFSNRQLDETKPSTYDERVQQKNREFIEQIRKQNYKEDSNVTPGATNAQRANRFIEQEIRKIEKTGNWDNSIPTTRLTDIRKTIEDYLGLGIKKGHFRERAYGIYKQDRDVIRGKELKDIDNILHETGHALDLGNRLNIDKETIANELLTAIKKHGGYENETRSVQLDEGFAEVIREYSIIPEQAKKDYPQSVAVLEQIRKADKSFNDFITKVQQQTYNYIHQNPQNRVHSNISIGESNKTPLTKSWLKQEVMRNIWDKDFAVKKVVNDFAKIRGKTIDQTAASSNAYYLTRLATGIHDKVTSMLSDGYIDENGNKLMPGLSKIGEILGENPQRYNDLRDYLVAKRDTDYKSKTLKTGIRDMDTKYVLEKFKNDNSIKSAAKVVYDTLDGVMQYAVDNGLISEKNAKNLKESNAFYVPMQRVIENRDNQIGRKGAVSDIIKARTGSELDIKDVLENIVANSSNIIQQVENNNILRALYKQGEEAGLTGTIYDVISTPMIKVGTANLSMWESELQKQGVKTTDLDLEKTIDLFVPNNKVDSKNLITNFINEDGKRVYLQFNDEILFNSLMNMDKKFMSQILKINSKLNMPLRYGATMANIGFAIPNMISDTAQASIFSNAGFIPVVDNALGVLDVLTATNEHVKDFVSKYSPEYVSRIENMYNIYKQTGATNSTRLSQFRDSTQNVMKDVYGVKKSTTLGINEKWKPLKRLLDIMTYIPEISEQSTRFRVFEKNYDLYKNKGTSEMDSRILAALESRDATQDFGRTGNITREINQLIPFSAARVGSAYTFAEKIKANPKQVGMRIALLTVLAMAIKGIGYDDKEIEELNQRKKDDNFVLKIGNQVVTIKKPQGILRSMLNLTEYIQDLATGHIEEGKEGERLGEWINNAIMDNMPADSVTGLVPNAVAPLIENAINKDFYYNTDIVKSYDLDLPDSEQYYDYNSQLAILLGKAFNYSPAKIDNLISGYFAGLGTQVTNIMDYVSGKMGLIAQKPEMGAESNSVGKRFIVNVNNNSASIDEIYNRKTELTKKKNGGTITSEEETELATITDAVSNISKVNKQIKEIKKDLTMSGAEKAEQIRPLQEQKTDIARQALGKDLIHQENTDKIADTSFYPTNSSLSLNNYKLELTSEMKKEYTSLASEFYKKYESQGLYNETKLKEIKTKAKEYAKKTLMQKYKSQLVKTK